MSINCFELMTDAVETLHCNVSSWCLLSYPIYSEELLVCYWNVADAKLMTIRMLFLVYVYVYQFTGDVSGTI